MAINKQVLDLLKNKVATAPRTEELQLDFMHINDLIPYMDLLAQLKYLKKLSLYGNRLKQLPIDMSSLQSLEQLDISNNLLTDVQMAIVSLKTLKNLKVLKYPLKKEKQSIVIESITSLNNLNDLKIIRQPAKKPLPLKYMKENTLQDFKQSMMNHFRKVKYFEQTNLDQKLADNSQQRFSMELQAVIKQSMKVLVEKEGEMTETLEVIYFNKTKYDIFQILKNRCLNMATDIYEDLGKLIKEVWDTQNMIFNSIFKQTVNLLHFQYEINEIERQRREDNSAGMEHKMYARNQHLEKEIKRIKKQKDELIIQINQLQSQNKRYLQSLVRYARGDKSGFVNIQNTIPSKQSNNQSFSQNLMPSQFSKPTVGTKASPLVRESVSYNYMSNSRNLTLKALKDTIQQIYESKQKFDQKNFDGKIPRETMHQYLFTHLNQKYGLKNLTIQAASSIVGGIQTYSAEDNDVAVFGKILKNQVDQQFRNVTAQIKSTINSLLKTYIKSQVPFKSAGQIEKIYNDKINGEVTSEEIQQIVKYLYNKTDSDKIFRKIDLLYKLNKPKEQQSHRRQMRDQTLVNEKQKKKLKFSIFLKTVLDFQLKNHERLLRPLLTIFKSRDRDSDGIVNEQQFIAIIEQLCEQATEIIPEMLMIVDPYETKSITYTQTVRLLSNYPESNPILNRYLQKEQIQQDIQ